MTLREACVVIGTVAAAGLVGVIAAILADMRQTWRERR